MKTCFEDMTIVSTEIQDTALHTGDRPGERESVSVQDTTAALHCIVKTKPKEKEQFTFYEY